MFDLSTKILIVDDMSSMRKMITNMCKDIGFTDIIGAEDGGKAWEILNSSTSPIGLVISDWNMPICTGIELLKKIRSDSRFAKTPFMMLTAEAEGKQVSEAVAAGVDAYVVKPFAQSALTEKIEAVYKKYAG